MAQAGYVRNARTRQLPVVRGSRVIKKEWMERGRMRLRDATDTAPLQYEGSPPRIGAAAGSGLTHAVRGLPKNKYTVPRHCCSSTRVPPWSGLLYRSTYFAYLAA